MILFYEVVGIKHNTEEVSLGRTLSSEFAYELLIENAGKREFVNVVVKTPVYDQWLFNLQKSARRFCNKFVKKDYKS